MARPLRLEYSGALYHVTSRGDRLEAIFLDDEDRHEWLKILADVCERFNWIVHAYCQMTNHFHLLVETAEGNLSAGMRRLNGIYTQKFNFRHKLVGHLFQGRYKAILVQKESHLLELSRYVMLNPVRARMVEAPEDWPWSSYLACINDTFSSSWLDTNWLLSQFGECRSQARDSFQLFVLEGLGLNSPLLATQHQLLLGDENFIEKHQSGNNHEKLRNVSLTHRRTLALSLETYQEKYKNQREAMVQAYNSGAYTMSQIASYFGVHPITVSRALREFDGNECG